MIRFLTHCIQRSARTEVSSKWNYGNYVGYINSSEHESDARLDRSHFGNERRSCFQLCTNGADIHSLYKRQQVVYTSRLGIQYPNGCKDIGWYQNTSAYCRTCRRFPKISEDCRKYPKISEDIRNCLNVSERWRDKMVADKMVRTKWHGQNGTDKMLGWKNVIRQNGRDKRVWTKWYRQIGTDKMLCY